MKGHFWRFFMIKSIKFQNFLSFYPEGEVDFSVNKHAPETFHFMECGSHRLSKASVILGPNGSGKSNVLLAIRQLKNFIAHSFSASETGNEYYGPHEAQKNKPLSFEVEFYIKKTLHKYSITLDKERVLLETLEHRLHQRMSLVYLRKYNSSKGSYDFESKELKLKGDFINMVRPNASVISTGSQFNIEKFNQIKNYWQSISFISPYIGNDIYEDSRYFYKHEDQFKKVKSYLKQLDLGLTDILIEQKERIRRDEKVDLIHLPYGVHPHKNRTFKIPFIYESFGTQRLYQILRIILPVLNHGSLCLIDEIESSLHSDMLPFLCDLFVAPESNPKGAQLLCTTHASNLLSEFSKYQVFLTEKNKNCESEIYRLDHLEGVRSDDNLSGKYLAGVYGGVPNIDI